jgi:hypothetical protein
LTLGAGVDPVNLSNESGDTEDVGLVGRDKVETLAGVLDDERVICFANDSKGRERVSL